MLKPFMGDGGALGRLGTMHPFKGLGEPEDIAKAAVFLASDDASWISGATLPVDGDPFLDLLCDCIASLPSPRGLHCPVVILTYTFFYISTTKFDSSSELIDDSSSFLLNQRECFSITWSTSSNASIIISPQQHRVFGREAIRQLHIN